MTLFERDALAVLSSINLVFMILILPNVVPIDYDKLGWSALLLTTFAWGIPLAAIGIWINHRTANRQKPSL